MTINDTSHNVIGTKLHVLKKCVCIMYLKPNVYKLSGACLQNNRAQVCKFGFNSN